MCSRSPFEWSLLVASQQCSDRRSVPAAFEAMPDVAKNCSRFGASDRARLVLSKGAGALVWLYASYMCGRQAAFARSPVVERPKAAIISSRERARKVAAVVAKFTAVVSLHAYCQRHWAIGAAA